MLACAAMAAGPFSQSTARAGGRRAASCCVCLALLAGAAGPARAQDDPSAGGEAVLVDAVDAGATVELPDLGRTFTLRGKRPLGDGTTQLRLEEVS